ncbi:MAG: hypothetical protein ACP5GS_07675 [Nitrososphaeria archaeon]
MTLPQLWSPGNVHDIELAIAILIATPGLVWLKRQKLWHRLNSSDFFRRAYVIFSFFFFLGFVFAMIFFAPGLYTGENILLVRVFQNIHPNYGHWLTWLAVFIVYARYGWKDLVKGSFSTGALVAVHEWLWYISYFIVHTIPVDALVLYYYFPFLILISSMLLFYYVHVRSIPAWRMRTMILVMIVYYFLWIMAGFPLTLDNVTGVTPFYYSLTVNMIEDASWLIPAVVLIA